MLEVNYYLGKAKNNAPLIYLETSPTLKTFPKKIPNGANGPNGKPTKKRRQNVTNNIAQETSAQNILQSIPLASRFNPLKEADRLLQQLKTKVEAERKDDKISNNNTSLVVILGAGNPFLLTQAANIFPQAIFLVIAKHATLAQLAKQALHVANKWLTENPTENTLPNNTVINNNKITYLHQHGHLDQYGENSNGYDQSHVNNKSSLHSAIKKFFKNNNHLGKNIVLLKNQLETQHDFAFFEKAINYIIAERNEKSINRNTFHRFEKIWITNLCSNVSTIIKAAGINELTNIAKGCHAILLGAGPSLEADIAALKTLNNKAYLIALDTTVKPLLNYGIMPHAIASVDPQKINAKYIENLPQKIYEQCLLFCEPAISPSALRHFNKVVMFNNFFPFYKLMMLFFGDKGEINSGGSVASAGYELARLMGFSTITLCGIDLSFKKNVYHVRGSMYENMWLQNCSRTSPFETKIHKLFSIETLKPCKNIAGETVFVDSPMIMYKNWFEKADGTSFLQRYNASKTGLQITGFQSLALKQWQSSITNSANNANHLKTVNTHLLQRIETLVLNKKKLWEKQCQKIQPSSNSNNTNKKQNAYNSFIKALTILLDLLKTFEKKAKKALTNYKHGSSQPLQSAMDYLSSDVLLRDIVSASMQKTIDTAKEEQQTNEREAKKMLQQLTKDALISSQLNIRLISRLIK